MSDWQPIETAPKNERLALLGYAPGHGVVMLYRSVWGGGTGYWYYKRENDYREMIAEEIEPTHWMPLPDKPETDS